MLEEENVAVEEDRSYCVYIHTNKINGKKYVGQTCRPNPEYRWNKDGKGYYRQAYFYGEIQEYGWDNFETEIVKSGLTREEANILESKLILQHDTLNRDKGYNLQAGGSGNHQKDNNKTDVKYSIPLKDKYLLTIKEICEYTGLEYSKMIDILNRPNDFTLQIDNEHRIIRTKFEKYIEDCAKYQISL